MIEMTVVVYYFYHDCSGKVIYKYYKYPEVMSQKEEGNQCFKDGRYEEAIEHYEKYVSEGHQDNKNALFNMSLCYSKLRKPNQSVEAAEKALYIDQNYVKCYYRLACEYQKIKGKSYEVFINAVRFLRVVGQEQAK